MKKMTDYIDQQGLRHSTQREIIAQEFFKTKGHVSVEDLYDRTRKVNSKIGIATVYRTMNLLQDCGLAVRRDFDTGQPAFELETEQHHDHLICTSCGKIVEFFWEEIEKNQNHIAKKHGFELQHHKMELYGVCKACQKKPKSLQTRQKS
ncbi:MAG: transcriptional repressor [Bdellovibrionales bacterium]|nr:transcriptional repressor [Bdellovibrionales bacterium]